MKSALFSLTLLGSACLASIGCRDGTATEGPAGPRVSMIRVGPVESRDVAPKVVVVGNITARRRSTVHSGADGVVQKFLVEHGQIVSEGELLCELRMVTTDLGIAEAEALLREREHEFQEMEKGSRQEDIDEAQAKMQAAEAVLRNAENNLERIRGLVEKRVRSKDELEDAIERAESAKKLLEAAQAVFDRVSAGPRVEQIEQARARRDAQAEHVKFLKAEREKRLTRAPFDGYIVAEETEVGQWVSKGDPIVQIVALDQVDVIAYVDQWDLPHIHIGDSASVHVKGVSRSEWTGEIVQIISRSDWESGSRGFPVIVRLKNEFVETGGAPAPLLREGMMAEVTFVGKPVEAVMIPKDALVRTSRGMLVNVFRPEEDDPQAGTAELVTVETGLSDGEWIQILSDEVKPGEQVVTEGGERLGPFPSVRIAPPRSADQSPVSQ